MSPFESFSIYASRLPYLGVYIIGLVLSLAFWRNHPRASLLSLIAFVLFIVASIVDGLFTWLVYSPVNDSYEANRTIARGVGQFLVALLHVAAWLLILIALFGRRSQAPTWRQEEQEPYDRPYPESGRPSGPPREDIRR
jgi:hypothetical protein